MLREIKKYTERLGWWQAAAVMRDFTTIKIGGRVKLFFPRGLEELTKTISLFNKEGLKYRILGNGSNLLVSDRGIKDIIIKLKGADFEYIRKEKNNLVAVGSGLSLQKLLRFCQEESLGGLEFLVGVPATLGGAIKNNAGALGKEIMDFVTSLTVLKKSGKLVKLESKHVRYSYRYLQLKKSDIIVGAVLRLRKTRRKYIRKRLDFNRAYRRRTQEIRFASAGCVFANPSLSLPAGLLIEAAGLKGFRKNKAAVSCRHANFIVNLGGASFKDVFYLIKYIEKNIRDTFGITLKREIEIWS
ncbi:MAG: UDP-N-acetylmuramate dehydrogenase [Candidatus Omnitrophica bacterium]|nr:UDP-N-acetylmuramate dehydrogenase [Candidatus Omnitrophota bacterium]